MIVDNKYARKCPVVSVPQELSQTIVLVVAILLGFFGLKCTSKK